jgi:hypothetical protein
MKWLVLLLPFVVGCAGWSPSAADAGSAARVIACTVCQATGGANEQAAAYAEALRQIAEMLARVAGDRADVKVILERLETSQRQQQRDFETLRDIAAKP